MSSRRKKRRDSSIDISSYDELMSHVHEMESSFSDGLLCYRGQVRDYPNMVPSMVRHVDSNEFDLKETVYGRRFWESVAEEIAAEHFPDGSWDPAITHEARLALCEGILQHYGFRTHFVDVTFNPDVALCFAHNQYSDLYPVFDGDVKRPKVRRVAWYEPSRESHGYLYVLDCVRWRPGRGRPRHGEVIDLTNLVRPGWNRVQMQQAMLVHSDPRKPNNGDLRPCVRASFKLPIPLPGCDAALKESRMWFPGPQDDPIYQSLLESRFVEQTYIADRPIRFSLRLKTDYDCMYLALEVPPYKEVPLLRRALDFPEYHKNPEDVAEIEFLRTFDRILEPTFYFPWFRESVGSAQSAPWAKRQSGKRAPDMRVLKKAAKGNAILVHVPFTELRRINGEVARVRYEPRETELSLFFEFSFYNFSGPYADDHTPRGIWIGGTADRLLVTVFGAADGKPWIADMGIFTWTDVGYEASVQTEPDMRQYLLIALKLLRDMAEGRAELLPLHEGVRYQQLRYPIELDGAEKMAD